MFAGTFSLLEAPLRPPDPVKLRPSHSYYIFALASFSFIRSDRRALAS